jgi:hypothetical protein
MQNIWDWQSEEERKKKEQSVGTPLQGVQYKQGESAPNPVVAGKEPSLAGTVTKMAEIRAVNKGFDKADEGAKWSWDQLSKQTPASVQDLSTPAIVTPTGGITSTGLSTLPSSVVSAPLSATVPVAGETAMAEGIAAAAPVAEVAAVGAPLAAEGAATAAAAAETAALASNPIGWIVGGYLLGKQFGLF